MATEHSLTLPHREGSTTILVGPGLLESVGERARAISHPTRVAVVTDENVAPLYLERVRVALKGSGFRVASIILPAGEKQKSLEGLSALYNRMVASELDRKSLLVCLGGGVIGDLGGFAAATFLRGISFAQVPTSLIAQVDASIGGKTGINHPLGKNLIGAFHQPRFVLAEVETLQTLPQREYIAGLAEVVKYGAALDASLLEQLESSVVAILGRDPRTLSGIIAACAALKVGVVAKDERDEGLRAVLNFGHTVGHALETLGSYERILHGEAVSIGMVAAGRVSAEIGLIQPDAVRRLARLLERLGLPTASPFELESENLRQALLHDKKMEGGNLRFIAMTELGRAEARVIDLERILGAALDRTPI